MNKQLTTSELRQLTIAERLRLLEDLWDTLAEVPETIGMPEWHRRELNARLDAHEQNPVERRPWDEVRAEILSRLPK